MTTPALAGAPRQRRFLSWFATAGLAMVAAFLLELALGPVRIPVSSVVGLLMGTTTSPDTWHDIVLAFRLPRALNALVSGAALGASGLLLQTLFRNPLADPFVLGIMHGARLGVAVLVVIMGVAGSALTSRLGEAGVLATSMAAGAGALAVLLLMLGLARRVSTVTLLISGLLIGYVCMGLISVLLHFVDEVQARAFEQWDGGSFDGVTRLQLFWLTPMTVAGLAVLAALSKALNGLLLGEQYAVSLGVHVGRTKALAFGALALLVGPVTAFSGPVPFLGLVAAHVARGGLATADHRLLLPASALAGAVLGLAADVVVHLPWNRHFLHLDAVIGIIGAPVALWVLLRPSSRHLRSTL